MMDKHSLHKKHWKSLRHAVVSNIFQGYSLQKALLVGTEEKRQKLWGLVMRVLVYYLVIVAVTYLANSSTCILLGYKYLQ